MAERERRSVGLLDRSGEGGGGRSGGGGGGGGEPGDGDLVGEGGDAVRIGDGDVVLLLVDEPDDLEEDLAEGRLQGPPPGAALLPAASCRRRRRLDRGGEAEMRSDETAAVAVPPGSLAGLAPPWGLPRAPLGCRTCRFTCHCSQ